MIADRSHKLAMLTLPVLLHAAAPAAAQPAVTADFRIESASVNRQASTLAENLRQPVAAEIAKMGREKFPYLAWKTATEPGATGARLILAVRDGPVGLCKPPAISADLIGASDTGEVVLGQRPFIEACDVAALASPEPTYLEKLKTAVDAFFADPAVQQTIQRDLLANIVLTNKLEPDPAKKELYLPIAPLRAGLKSTLVAFYGDQGVNGSLYMQPRGVTGPRQRVFLRKFRCGSDVVSGAEVPDGEPWTDAFVSFLDACKDEPQIFMTEYEPQKLSPIVTQPGGQP